MIIPGGSKRIEKERRSSPSSVKVPRESARPRAEILNDSDHNGHHRTEYGFKEEKITKNNQTKAPFGLTRNLPDGHSQVLVDENAFLLHVELGVAKCSVKHREQSSTSESYNKPSNQNMKTTTLFQTSCKSEHGAGNSSSNLCEHRSRASSSEIDSGAHDEASKNVGAIASHQLCCC
jgi:hypothetical protein